MKKLSDFLIKTNEDLVPVLVEPESTSESTEHIILHELVGCYCEEIDCWYKYFITSKFMKGAQSRESIEKLFEDNGKDELEDHAVKLLTRLDQLGWEPREVLSISDILRYGTHRALQLKDFSPLNMVQELYKDEEDAIAHYRKVEELTREIDPVTNTIVKEILIDEEEHRQKLKNNIDDFLC